MFSPDYKHELSFKILEHSSCDIAMWFIKLIITILNNIF